MHKFKEVCSFSHWTAAAASLGMNKKDRRGKFVAALKLLPQPQGQSVPHILRSLLSLLLPAFHVIASTKGKKSS